MIRNQFLFAFLLLFVTACAAPTQTKYPSYTPDLIQTYMDANASKGTAVAAVATAEYFSMQLTATIESRNQIGTQQAMQIQSQATERAWNATSTADSIPRHRDRLGSRPAGDLDSARNGCHRHSKQRIGAGFCN